MNLQEYIAYTKSTYTNSDGEVHQKVRPRVICKDGHSLSIQVGEGYSCSPKENDSDFYESVEVAFPSTTFPPEWEDYLDKTYLELCSC